MNRMLPRLSLTVLCLLILSTQICSQICQADDRPNVIVILIDDMGFSDIGCYGSEIPTPNLDKLADGGMKFSQFYNTGRCCPTRASLLTGLYSHRAGVGHMTENLHHPGYQGFLNDECVTIGDIAREAGYMSLATGKWHVGNRTPAMLPRSRGFDRFYGVPEGGGFYFQVKAGRTILHNDEVVASMAQPLPEGFYSTDAWTEHGLHFIDESIAVKKPFLLYLAHNAPHFPLQAPKEDIDRFRGKYAAGWDKLSEERHQRQLKMGLVDADWKKTERPDSIRAWDSLSDEERVRFDSMMATYAACVYRMDKSIGTLVEGLKSRGQFENTLILFMSDNGGCAESGPNGKTVGDPSTANSDWFCGESWAWMQDTPFRKYKHYNHEGGIATPLIAHWPAEIEKRDLWEPTPTHLIDVMATIVDVTGATYPTTKNDVKIAPAAGKSLRPLFSGEILERRGLFWEHEGNAAARKGDWKLVRLGGDGKWELYNMNDDRTEQNDLAETKPEIVDDLVDAWQTWAKENQVATNGLPKAERKQGAVQADGKRKGKKKAVAK